MSSIKTSVIAANKWFRSNPFPDSSLEMLESSGAWGNLFQQIYEHLKRCINETSMSEYLDILPHIPSKVFVPYANIYDNWHRYTIKIVPLNYVDCDQLGEAEQQLGGDNPEYEQIYKEYSSKIAFIKGSDVVIFLDDIEDMLTSVRRRLRQRYEISFTHNIEDNDHHELILSLPERRRHVIMTKSYDVGHGSNDESN